MYYTIITIIKLSLAPEMHALKLLTHAHTRVLCAFMVPFPLKSGMAT